MATKKKSTAATKPVTAKKSSAKKVTTVAKAKAVKKASVAKKATTVKKKAVATTKAVAIKKKATTAPAKKVTVTKKAVVAKKVSATKKKAVATKSVTVKKKSVTAKKAVVKKVATPKVSVQLKGAAVKKVEEKPFAFNDANEKRIKNILKRYPKEQAQSALIPVLKLAQDQNGGWLSNPCIKATAERLDIAFMRALEVATFYTMFNLDPVGKYHVQVCTNCSCMIRGSGKIVDAVKEFTGIASNGDTSEDEMFTLTEVECLGACVEAPMMQINNHYYTKLDKEQTIHILDALRKGEEVANATPTAPLPEMY